MAVVATREPRFYVQQPHVDGLAVIDRQKATLVLSSFGDTEELVRTRLQLLADGLNAAVESNIPQRNDLFKLVPDPLKWRVIEYLSSLYREEAYGNKVIDQSRESALAREAEQRKRAQIAEATLRRISDAADGALPNDAGELLNVIRDERVA